MAGERKPATPAAPSVHPLMVNRREWDRDAVMAIVCERIASSSRAITTLLAEGYNGHPLPAYSKFALWLTEDGERGARLRDLYARAKEAQADYLAEEMLDIADDARNDWMAVNAGEDVVYKANGEHAQRCRLRLDTRKWLAAKLKPKKYGEQSRHEITGADGGALVVEIVQFAGDK